MHRLCDTTRLRWLTLATVLTISTCAAAGDQEVEREQDGKRFFTDRIEPLLKSRCFGCHSHSAGEMEGGLTLDSRGGWQQGGSRGPAVVPDKPEDSLLIQAVRGTDSKLQMPPDDRLSPAQIELLVEWVQRGAPDPRETAPDAADEGDPLDWWSLRPLKRPAIPQSAIHQQAASDVDRGNPIDAFIHERLDHSGIATASAADRRTLIRRVYFDLHGLPPSPKEVDAFVADSDPDAYEKLVDRLLASPRYGERWARHWLDTIHFADSHGCEHDVFRPNAWRYRDYVIAALNRDTSWSRFIREQLAVDRFYPDESHLTPALGFIGAGPLELSRASTAPVTFDYLDRDDMVTQTMAAFASTTANCARCHDHKFDPITQEDYYSLQAVFAGVGKGDVEFDVDPRVSADRKRWNDLLKLAESGEASRLLADDLTEVVLQWEKSFGTAASTWEPLVLEKFESAEGSTLTLLDDNSLLASGSRPEKDTYTITAPVSLLKLTALRLTALRLDVLADDRLPLNGPGRQDNGNLHLSEFEAWVETEEQPERQRIKIRAAKADWDQAGWTIAHAVDGNDATAWGIYPKVGQSHHAVFELEEPLQLSADSRVVIVLKQLHGGSHLIGRVKLYATAALDAAVDVVPNPVRLALKVPRAQRSLDQQAAIAAFALKQHAEKQLAALPLPESVYAISRGWSHGKKLDQPMDSPRTVHVLKRGNIELPGKVATPGSLTAITALTGRFIIADPNDEAARRAAMADWLASSDNPLTWRSIVNRVWAYHFGRGLCDTPNDFGRMGGVPTHPELLDWLAVWFRDDAQGSLKQLHRRILLSATWRQQSSVPATVSVKARDVDAGNRLLWRMNNRRLDAESYRDAVLQISGRIDLAMGGPGIQQFTQSPGQQLTPKLDYDGFDWNASNAARRSIYRVVWRGTADPFMESLDFPDLGLLSPKRGFSVSALQSLAVFNNDFVLHHSQVLADRLAANYQQVDDQVTEACGLIYLREPGDEERVILAAYARQHGLAALCRVLLNSNEFLFIE